MMMVSWSQQFLPTALAGAKSALKDKANGFEFATFIEAERRSLTALVAPVTALASIASKVASDVRLAENTSAIGYGEITREMPGVR